MKQIHYIIINDVQYYDASDLEMVDLLSFSLKKTANTSDATLIRALLH